MSPSGRPPAAADRYEYQRSGTEKSDRRRFRNNRHGQELGHQAECIGVTGGVVDPVHVEGNHTRNGIAECILSIKRSRRAAAEVLDFEQQVAGGRIVKECSRQIDSD